MAIKLFFSDDEQQFILEQRKKKFAVHHIAKQLHRSRRNIFTFLADPEKYRIAAKAFKKEHQPQNSPKKRKTPKTVAPVAKINPKSTEQTPTSATSASSVPFSKTSTSPKKLTVKELASFSKVIVEHRSVIKFLVKQGESAKTIYARLKKVYKPMNPEMPAIQYWTRQFKQGRETIFNDTATAKRISSIVRKPQSKPASGNILKKSPTKSVRSRKPKKQKEDESPNKKVVVSSSKNNKGIVEAPSRPNPPVNTKTLKRKSTGSATFQIKLPSFVRLNKTLL